MLDLKSNLLPTYDYKQAKTDHRANIDVPDRKTKTGPNSQIVSNYTNFYQRQIDKVII